MAYNGSGTFSLAAGNPVVTGTTISSTWANNTLSDIATGLSTVICKDGQTTVTANLPMATFKHTGVGAASATTEYARYDQVQNSAPMVLASVAGTNTVTGTASPTPAAYVRGQVFRFDPAVTNTGATTLNVSSLGAGAVQSRAQALVGGELIAGVPVSVFVSTSTPVFEILNSAPFADSRPLVVGSADATKKVRLEVDGLTTATTRVITVADANFTIGTGWELISTGTASNSATLDFTGLTGYAAYAFVFGHVRPATDGASLQIRVSEDNGSNWQADASDYSYGYERIGSAGGETIANSTGAAAGLLIDSVRNDANAYQVCGTLIAADLGSASGQVFTYEVAAILTDDNLWVSNGAIAYIGAAAVVNGIRVMYSSGNIASGVVKCYGIRG
jgi:hypothetical protein